MKKNNSKIQFLWEGKEEALLQHLTPPSCTYEQPNDIQGNEIHCVDNLDFLKLNQERLRGKVKCIYIDPPYNTGRDFIYKDKRHGRGECKHSNWLSFMYPRLVLARELLREDGVIFISIDDNEVHHLRLLMNEVFGEGEFVGQISVINNLKGRNDATYFKDVHEYILVYKKDDFKIGSFVLNEDEVDEYNLEDEFGLYKKGKTLQKTGDNSREIDRPNLFYPIYVDKDNNIYTQKPNIETIEVLPMRGEENGRWTWAKQKVENEKYNIFVSRNRDKITLYIKQRLEIDGLQRGKFAKSVLYKPEYNTGAGVQELKNLLGTHCDIKPKSVFFIKDLLQISTAPGDLILDFFAGSGTTGQAVMELNQEEIDKQAKDGLLADKTTEVGGRKFILVQLPEKIDDKKEAFKAGYRHISDITIERVRRAGAKYKGDVGFKVFDCIKKTELLEKYQ